jgi:hypothetical protein
VRPWLKRARYARSHSQLRQVLESLVAQYKGKEEQIAALQKQLSSAA